MASTKKSNKPTLTVAHGVVFNVYFTMKRKNADANPGGRESYEHESCVVIAPDIETAIKKAKSAFPRWRGIYFVATKDTYGGVPRPEWVVL